jgi:hypothetical protein
VAHLVHLRAQRDMSAATMAHLNAQPKVVLWLLQDEKASKASKATEFTPVKTTMNRTSALAAYA